MAALPCAPATGTLPAYGVWGWLDMWNVAELFTYFIQVGGQAHSAAGRGALLLLQLPDWTFARRLGSRCCTWAGSIFTTIG